MDFGIHGGPGTNTQWIQRDGYTQLSLFLSTQKGNPLQKENALF